MTGLIIMSTSSKSKRIATDQKFISDVVELKVVLGDEDARNSTEVSLNELFEYAKESKSIPHTSQPTPFEMETAIKNGLNKYDNLIITTPHHTISGTYQSVVSSVNNLDVNDNVTVIECNGGIAVTEVALNDKILQWLEQGLDYQSIVSKAIEYNKHLVTYCFPGDFDYLKISGRVKGAQALLLNALSLRVVIKMIDDAPILDGKGRGEKYIFKYIQKEFTDKNIEKIFYTPINDNELMRETVCGILENMNIPYEITAEANSVPAAHLGPNNFGLGVAYIDEK